jgi:hypothetical protein
MTANDRLRRRPIFSWLIREIIVPNSSKESFQQLLGGLMQD